MKFRKLFEGDFPLKEGRSQGLSFDKTYRLFLENCTEYRAFLTQIFRGVNGFNSNYGVVKPKQAAKRRQSAHTKNYYTLIIDNSEYWSEYPDRGESIVCTTDPKMAGNYGTLYLVIPYDGANLGVAPKVDIWQSFDQHLEHFNNMLEEIIFEAYKYWDKSFSEKDIPQKDYQKFKNYILKVDRTLKNLEKDYQGYSQLRYEKHTKDFVTRYLEMDFDNLYEYLEWFFKPERNGFERMNYNSNFSISRRQEIWTDSPSLLIKHDKVTDFFEVVNEHSDRDIDAKWLSMAHDGIS